MLDNLIKTTDRNYSSKSLSKYSEAYYRRGDMNLFLNKLNEACKDWSKAGELGYNKAYESISEYCN